MVRSMSAMPARFYQLRSVKGGHATWGGDTFKLIFFWLEAGAISSTSGIYETNRRAIPNTHMNIKGSRHSIR